MLEAKAPARSRNTEINTEPNENASGWFRHLFQYTLVGGIAAVADLSVFAFLAKHLEINYLISATMSFIAGTAINFLLCFQFVFRLKGHSPAVALWRKLVSSLIALAVNLGVMFILVGVLAFDQISYTVFGPLDGLLLARFFAICTSFFINFLLTKYYAFRDY